MEKLIRAGTMEERRHAQRSGVTGRNDGFLRFLAQTDELFDCVRINKRLIANEQCNCFHIRRGVDQMLHGASNRSSHSTVPIYVFNHHGVFVCSNSRAILPLSLPTTTTIGEQPPSSAASTIRRTRVLPRNWRSCFGPPRRDDRPAA